MDNHELAALKQEIAKLREDVAEVRLYANKHFYMFTAHLVEQDQEIGSLYSHVMAVVRKVFPGYGPSKKQIDILLNRKSPSRFRRDPDPDKKPDEKP
jgi:hypothetical protein